MFTTSYVVTTFTPSNYVRILLFICFLMLAFRVCSAFHRDCSTCRYVCCILMSQINIRDRKEWKRVERMKMGMGGWEKAKRKRKKGGKKDDLMYNVESNE